MANSKKKQPSIPALHQQDLLSGSLSIHQRLRSMLVEAISSSPLSRYQIAAQMSELVGREITKTMLDAYVAESKEGHRLPAELMPAFCAATGDWRPLILLVESLGGMVLSPKEKTFIQLVRIDREKARLEKRARALKEEMEREA